MVVHAYRRQSGPGDYERSIGTGATFAVLPTVGQLIDPCPLCNLSVQAAEYDGNTQSPEWDDQQHAELHGYGAHDRRRHIPDLVGRAGVAALRRSVRSDLSGLLFLI